MRLAVISDTHLPRFGRSLPAPLVAGMTSADVELVLHLGDWTSLRAVEAVESLRIPLDGVAGNNDPPEIAERFGRTKVIEVEGVRIGLTHGDLGPGRTTPERAIATFEQRAELDLRTGNGLAEPSLASPPQVVLFGHSHIPIVERLDDGRLLLNPGSPTDKRRQVRYSWALLEIRDGRVDAELRFFGRGSCDRSNGRRDTERRRRSALARSRPGPTESPFAGQSCLIDTHGRLVHEPATSQARWPAHWDPSRCHSCSARPPFSDADRPRSPLRLELLA